jgi:hypothetical protein
LRTKNFTEEKSMQTITEIIKPISLLKGSHEDTAQTGSGCFMNVIAYLNGEPQITDQSPCVCVTVRSIAIWFNDFLRDNERGEMIPFIERAMGSATNDKAEMARRLGLVVKFAERQRDIARSADDAASAANYAASANAAAAAAANYANYAANYAASANAAAAAAANYANYAANYAASANAAASAANYAASANAAAAAAANYANYAANYAASANAVAAAASAANAANYANYAANYAASANAAASAADYAADEKFREQIKAATLEFLGAALPKAVQPTGPLIERAKSLVA